MPVLAAIFFTALIIQRTKLSQQLPGHLGIDKNIMALESLGLDFSGG